VEPAPAVAAGVVADQEPANSPDDNHAPATTEAPKPAAQPAVPASVRGNTGAGNTNRKQTKTSSMPSAASSGPLQRGDLLGPVNSAAQDPMDAVSRRLQQFVDSWSGLGTESYGYAPSGMGDHPGR